MTFLMASISVKGKMSVFHVQTSSKVEKTDFTKSSCATMDFG